MPSYTVYWLDSPGVNPKKKIKFGGHKSASFCTYWPFGPKM